MRLKVNEEARIHRNREFKCSNYRCPTPENSETVKQATNFLFISMRWLFHAALKQREPDGSSCEPPDRWP
jgi:hypothetical protein